MKRATCSALAPCLVLAGALAACAGTDVRLDVPPAGTGFQLGTPRFAVEPGTEVERCYFLQVPPAPTGESSWSVNAIEVGMNVGSHDMTLYRTTNPWAAANVPMPYDASLAHDCPALPLGGGVDLLYREVRATASATKWSLPDGVVLRLQPMSWLVLRTHYANTTVQPTPVAGRVVLNFFQLPEDPAMPPPTEGACAMFLDDTTLSVAPGTPTPSTVSCALPTTATAPVRIIGVLGHTGSRGRTVTLSAAGTPAPIYTSELWDARDFTTWPHGMEPPPMLAPGASVTLSCAYQNDTGAALPYGPLAETNEQCDAVVYFAPCVPEDGVYCR